MPACDVRSSGVMGHTQSSAVEVDSRSHCFCSQRRSPSKRTAMRPRAPTRDALTAGSADAEFLFFPSADRRQNTTGQVWFRKCAGGSASAQCRPTLCRAFCWSSARMAFQEASGTIPRWDLADSFSQDIGGLLAPADETSGNDARSNTLILFQQRRAERPAAGETRFGVLVACCPGARVSARVARTLRSACWRQILHAYARCRGERACVHRLRGCCQALPLASPSMRLQLGVVPEPLAGVALPAVRWFRILLRRRGTADDGAQRPTCSSRAAKPARQRLLPAASCPISASMRACIRPLLVERESRG